MVESPAAGPPLPASDLRRYGITEGSDVNRGRVACPLRGDTDVEACFVCGHMSGAHLDGLQPSLRCAVERGPWVLDRMAYWP